MKPKVKVGLALSGGAAKGFVHVGVIQALEELGVEIHAISGTSMGAIVGGWYAATKDIGALAAMARRRDWLPSWRDISPRKVGALFNIAKIEQFLRKQLGSPKIEGLKIPFAAVATDITSGREVVLKKGDLVQAMLASSAVPAVFPPVKYGNMLLVDGGLTNPLPFDVAKELGADVVIGVDLFRDAASYSPDHIASGQWKPWYIFRVIYDSLQIMQDQLARNRAKRGDIMLMPRVGHIPSTAFNRAEEAMREGRNEVWVMRHVILKAAGLPEKPETFAEKFWNFLKKP